MTDFSRSKTYHYYLFEAVFLIYCLYGAFTGTISLPLEQGAYFVIQGWATWLACLCPLLMGVATFIMVDPIPRQNFGMSQRLICFLLIMLMAIASIIAPVIFKPV